MTVKFAVSGAAAVARPYYRVCTCCESCDVGCPPPAAMEREGEKIKREARASAKKGDPAIIKAMAKNIVAWIPRGARRRCGLLPVATLAPRSPPVRR